VAVLRDYGVRLATWPLWWSAVRVLGCGALLSLLVMFALVLTVSGKTVRVEWNRGRGGDGKRG
jgi:hypothetical protein